MNPNSIVLEVYTSNRRLHQITLPVEKWKEYKENELDIEHEEFRKEQKIVSITKYLYNVNGNIVGSRHSFYNEEGRLVHFQLYDNNWEPLESVSLYIPAQKSKRG
ncbi:MULTISPECIES: hypothetical protein [Fictibacillus]|uniref:hypothetical protein n=2 Tax=Fictibacillus TaxID=1329200 RepID=UPI0010102E75|nr:MULTISPECIES: hypothetical protein [Fictibacillus]MDM5199819.1 hypothetical protein [Fictibacillus enclensis]RXY98399.1 hypothetical protein DMO16_01190 [Fictibacillus sp. S7]